MFDFWDLQIPPPKTWQHFESLCRDLWAEIWCFPEAKKHGRSGQAQQGVDVYGRPKSGKDWAAVQCKGKDNYTDKRVTEHEFKVEVKKALDFEPPLKEFTLATTGPRDAKIQRLARIITTRHATNGLFAVDVVAWDDIVELLGGHPNVLEKHYPQFAGGLLKLKHLEVFVSETRDSIGGDLSAIGRQIKRDFASVRDVLQQQDAAQMANTIHETSILHALSRIEESLAATTKSKTNTHIVEVLPPDKERTLGLIATSMFDGTASSHKKFLPDIPWERDVRFLRRKGVLVSKKGVLTVPSRITRALLSSDEFKTNLHQEWLKALQPFKNHPDVAAEISWHLLRLGEYWKSAKVFIDLLEWGKPLRWERDFCECLLTYRKKEILKKFTPEQHVQFLHACVQYLINCDRSKEALRICGELRSFSKRHNNNWGVVQSYLKTAEAHDLIEDDAKAERNLRKAVEIAQAHDEKAILATANYSLAIHLDETSPCESLALLAQCAKLRRETQDPRGVVDAQICSGVVSSKHGKLATASNWFRESAQNAKSIEYVHGESLAKLFLGILEVQREEYVAALKLLRESRNIAEPARYLNTVADTFAYEGVVFNGMERYGAAQSAFEKAFEIRKDNEHWDAAVSALNNVGAMLLFRQKAAAGRKKLRAAYNLAVEHDLEFWTYQCQWNIATSFLQCDNDPKRATKCLREAAKAEEARAAYTTAGQLWQDRLFLLIEHRGRRVDIDDAYRCALRCFKQDWESVVILHEGAFTKYREERSDDDAAMQVLRELATRAARAQDIATHGRAFAQLGSCLMEQDRLDEAEGLLLEAIRDGRKSKCELLHVFLQNTGDYYNRVSDPTKAAHFFAQASTEAITQDDYQSAFESTRSLALALGAAEKFDKSESAVKEFCEKAKRNEQWAPYVRGLELLGDLSWWRNRPKTAEHQYRRALDAATTHDTRDVEASVRLEYAKTLGHSDRPRAALACLEDHQSLFNTDLLEHEYHSKLAWIYETLGKKRSERRHRTHALAKAIDSGDSECIADSAWAMSDVYEERGDFDQALDAIELSLQHEPDAERRVSIMMKRLAILLRLRRKRAVGRAFEDIQSVATDPRFVSELVDAYVWVGDFSADNGESLLSVFKHYLAAHYYAYDLNAKTVAEIQAHMLHRLSLIKASDRQSNIRRLETNCRKWLENDPDVKLGQEAVAAMLMPFRVAQRLSLLATDWRKVSDQEFDRILDEELPGNDS